MTGRINRKKVGFIEVLTLDNPPHNVMTMAMRDSLRQILSDLIESQQRVVLITGAAQAFCAGSDLQRYADTGGMPFSSIDDLVQYDRDLFGQIEALPIPVIAAIDGYCIGAGLELALSCDIRIVAETARFRSPGVRLGMIANTVRLNRIVGQATARYLMLTGSTIDGREATRVGLAQQCYTAGIFLLESMKLAEVIGSRAPLSVKAVKDTLGYAIEHDDHEILRRESAHNVALKATEDHRIGIQAVMRGTVPRFEGR